MSAATAGAMYKLKPAFKLPETIELPRNMYNLPKIQAVGETQYDIQHSVEAKVNKIMKLQDGEIVDLELRWDRVLVQLKELKAQLAEIRKSVNSSNTMASTAKPAQPIGTAIKVLDGAVINANPASPPFTLLLLKRLFEKDIKIEITSHVHSSVVSSIPDDLTKFNSSQCTSNGLPKLHFTLIWKEGIFDTELIVSPVKQIPLLGEVNILRYLARLGLSSLKYGADPSEQLMNDIVLDYCHQLLHLRADDDRRRLLNSLNETLGKDNYFGKQEVNISDIAVWSALKQINLASGKGLPGNLAKWFNKINGQFDI